MATFDLFSAVKDGDTDTVRTLLTSRRCRSHLNDRNEWGDTVLHLAAEAGNSEVCQMLIAGGASVTVRNNRGETCLHRAAVGGHTDCVTAIVERDNDPEAVNSQNDAGYTALHHAAKHGTIDLIQVLLQSGSDRMLENNAGETPYMVAHKYQQYEAERLLLNIEQQHADKAIQEMNTKPKKIIAAYSKALKNAHKPESRIRLVLVGDQGSGKTSLRKTLFGESFKPDEEPTKCIYADSSMARIQFRQYREWIIQPSSKADAHRLNLEYNDAIIDYILNEVRKPGVSDEVVDLKKLGLHKQPKNVNFESTPSIIPLLSSSSSSEKIEEETSNVSVTNSIENTSSSFVSSSETSSSSSPSFTTSPNRGRQGTIVAKPTSTLDGSDDISEVEEGPVPQEEPSSLPSDPSVPAPTPPTTNEKSKTKLTIFDSTLEMSKVLMEHIPFEVLKRLVMRWPVDGEDVMDLESLSRRRLLIHVWDCSGDPLQLSVVPLFFSSRSIFLVMHNMENNLSHQAQSYLKQNLTNLRGSCPTNAQALEEWVAGITAQTEDTPTGPRPMHQSFPQLPPIIFVASHSDSEEVLNPFNEFFTLPSFNSYNRHMLETNFVAVSNFHESSLIDDYSGHHYLRREIDHLARQMPYIHDMIPVQWVKFEQLLHLLIEQKKVVIQLSDLERYISDRCDIIGPLQVQPALAYYNQIGIVVHMYKHPALAPLIVVKPQWLLDALASVFASSSTSWITVEVRQSFATLYTKGYIRRDILLLAYRCAHLPQRYWNELLYFINYMDLIACHSSLHESTSIFIPAVVNKTAPTFSFGPTGNDPATLYFSCGSTVLPMSLFNQLVVRCIRTCAYVPVLFHEIVHLRLNYSHHLILRREGPSICVLVQTNTVQFCSYCPENEKSYEVQQECNHLTHIVDHDKGTSTSEHLETYQLFIDQLPNVMLYLSDDLTMLDEICPRVLSFLEDSMEFLMRCWYPGLRFKLTTENELLIDRKWKQNVLEKGLAPPKLALWFNY